MSELNGCQCFDYYYLIFYFQVSGKTLFPGDSEIDQLFRVFRALGTPGDEVWPAARMLPDYRPSFPRWPAREARTLLPAPVRASIHACTLFEAMLRYEPSERVSARAALQHPYFADARLVPPALPAAPVASSSTVHYSLDDL